MNSPVTVFEHNGKQYVAAYSAGNLFAGSAKGDSVWLFALDGTLDPRRPRGGAMLFARDAEGTANPDAGKTVYDDRCTFCHGEHGEGGHGGGKPLVDARSADVRDPDRERGPQGHAAARRGVDRGADPRRRGVRRDTVGALNACSVVLRASRRARPRVRERAQRCGAEAGRGGGRASRTPRSPRR